jgi:hypothetical protein
VSTSRVRFDVIEGVDDVEEDGLEHAHDIATRMSKMVEARHGSATTHRTRGTLRVIAIHPSAASSEIAVCTREAWRPGSLSDSHSGSY